MHPTPFTPPSSRWSSAKATKTTKPPRTARGGLVFALAALLTLTLLTGCLGTPRDDGTHPTTPGGPDTNATDEANLTLPITDWSLRDCFYLDWQVPADQETLQKHLPNEFTLDTTQDPLGFGLPGSYLAVQGLICTQQHRANTTLPETSHAQIYTRVHPPETLNTESVNHFYSWATLTTDSTLQAVLEETGAPVHAGTGTSGRPVVPTPVGPGFGWYMDIEMETFGDFHGDVSTTEYVPMESSVDRFYQVAGEGVLVWEGSLTTHEETEEGMTVTGSVLMEASGGDWIQDAIGEDEAHGIHRLAYVHLNSGSIQHLSAEEIKPQ